MPLANHWASQGMRVNGTTTRIEKMAQLTASGIQAFQLKLEELNPEEPSPFFNAPILVLCVPPGPLSATYPGLMRKVAQAARLQGCQRVIFTSSTGVYGSISGTITEDQQPVLDNVQAQNMYQTETNLKEELGNDLCILRLAGLAGPGRHPGRWLAGKQALPNGQQVVNLVHLQDVIGVIDAVIKQDAWGQCFNVCADVHPTRQDFYSSAAASLKLVRPIFSTEDSKGAKGRTISNSRVKSVLGYTFQYPDPELFTY